MALTRVDVRLLSGLLGLLLALYGMMGLLRPPFKFAQDRETITGIASGLANGVLAGMTGSFSIPGVPWLQALGLTRDQLIQGMGMLFSLSSLCLALALNNQNLLNTEMGLLSAASVIPALAGMLLGQTIRKRLSEPQFRLVFFWSLITLGLYIVVRVAF